MVSDIQPQSAKPQSRPLLLSRRHALIGGVLACASGFAFLRQPAVANPVIKESQFEGWVPEQFGQWKTISQSGEVLPPPDTLSDRLYDNLITQVYAAPGLPAVMLLLAYNNAQDGVLQVHRPEVCYPVGGFELSATREMDIQVGSKIIPANFFTATSPNRIEQVAYFTRLGRAYPRSWAEQRVAVMQANLEGDIPDGIMMRVSVLSADAGRAEDQLQDFSRAFITAAPAPLRRVLLGTAT